eukprot:2305222-Lingulodinium_polyedra.AAC.1
MVVEHVQQVMPVGVQIEPRVPSCRVEWLPETSQEGAIVHTCSSPESSFTKVGERQGGPVG